MALFDFLTEGNPVEAVPVSSTQQTILPDWYTNYAMDILANQQAVSSNPYTTYQGPRVAEFTPDQQAAFEATRQNAFGFRPELGTAATQTQGQFGRSGLAAAQPNLQQAGQYAVQSTDALGLSMAQPYLQQAGTTAVQNIGAYMNPYTEQVVNRIGELGTRTLKEQILPGIESEMIRAGQFGGTRQAELTGRAIRDAMEGISAQQAQALQQGYGQGLTASQADLARQAQLASTAGGFGFQQQGALAQAGQQMGALGQQLGSLYNADTAQQLAAAQQLAQMAQQRQQQELAGSGALQQVGALQQQQGQRNLDVAYEDFMRQQAYPQQQIQNMVASLQGVQPAVPQAASKVGTEVPNAFSPSLLSTLGQGYATYKAFSGG